MKEFIDKLIEKLEEKRKFLENTYLLSKKSYEVKKDAVARINELGGAIEVVNELAEEYERETDQTDYANIELYAFWKNHQWIPCSERLPKRNEYVLCYAKSTARGGDTWFVGSCDNGFWFLQSSIGTLSCPTQYEVVAWMPLPAPYTENKVSEMPTDWQQNIVGRFNRVE